MHFNVIYLKIVATTAINNYCQTFFLFHALILSANPTSSSPYYEYCLSFALALSSSCIARSTLSRYGVVLTSICLWIAYLLPELSMPVTSPPFSIYRELVGVLLSPAGVIISWSSSPSFEIQQKRSITGKITYL